MDWNWIGLRIETPAPPAPGPKLMSTPDTPSGRLIRIYLAPEARGWDAGAMCPPTNATVKSGPLPHSQSPGCAPGARKERT